jgi:hypothetical protein
LNFPFFASQHWEESLQRIANEQDLYQAQVEDVRRLKQESERLRIITSKLTSFNSTISAVSERLSPKYVSLRRSESQFFLQTSTQTSSLFQVPTELNSNQLNSTQQIFITPK